MIQRSQYRIVFQFKTHKTTATTTKKWLTAFGEKGKVHSAKKLTQARSWHVSTHARTHTHTHIHKTTAVVTMNDLNRVLAHRYGDLHGMDQMVAVQRVVWQLRGSSFQQGLSSSHGLWPDGRNDPLRQPLQTVLRRRLSQSVSASCVLSLGTVISTSKNVRVERGIVLLHSAVPGRKRAALGSAFRSWLSVICASSVRPLLSMTQCLEHRALVCLEV